MNYMQLSPKCITSFLKSWTSCNTSRATKADGDFVLETYLILIMAADVAATVLSAGGLLTTLLFTVHWINVHWMTRKLFVPHSNH